MKKTSFVLFAFTILFVSCIYAQPGPPILLAPADLAMGVPTENVILQFDQPGWQIESFFDIYFSPEPLDPLDPDPGALMYSGPLAPSRTFFEYHIAALLAEQTYYWFVRYSNFIDTWTSQVRQFTTGTYVIPSSVVSGKTLYPSPPGGFIAGITITCSANGIVIGKAYSSGIDGSYSFILANSTTVTYYVTPVPPSATKYFSPTFYSYSNLSQDQFNQDFYQMSYTPNGAINPVPYNMATGVSINIGQLQWTYIQLPGYGTPTAFEVYLPADNPVPAIVPYIPDRDTLYSHPIGPLLPMTEYEWRVTPINVYGPYELSDTWWFLTEPLHLESVPELEFPLFADDFESGTTDAWSVVMPRDRPVEDWIFDVYMDTDSTFVLPPNYTGDGHPDPANPGYYWSKSVNLAYGAHYYWKVKCTDTSTGLSSESLVAEFWTRPDPTPPILVLPPDNAIDVPVLNTDLAWELVNWVPDSFFDVYCDIDSLFPNPPIWSGPLPPSRDFFHFLIPNLLPQTHYYWRVSYTSLTGGYTVQSLVNSFWTASSPVMTSVLSGTIIPGNPAFDVSGVIVTCPGAYEPSTIVTGPDGHYSFTVENGGTYVISPAKALCYFEPASFAITNVQTDQVQDFIMNSLLPHAACNPIPVNGDVYVPHDLGRISWQYIPQPGYALPAEFLVYLPADAPEPLGIVPYTGRAVDMFLDITGDIPGESADAKVKGRNGHGESIDILEWSWGMTNPGTFHSGGGGGRPKCDYPGYAGKADFADIVLKLEYDVPSPVLCRANCTVFLDTSIVPLTIVYQGRALPYPQDSTRCYFYSPELQPNTIYHWFVRVVDPVMGDTIDTNNYAFRTAESLIEPTPPLLVSPEPGALNIPPEGVDLVFEQNPWLVDSFFDIYMDTDPGFPQPPVYSGPLLPSGPYFEFHKAALLDEQAYNWYVRYTDFMDNRYANSLVRQFTTGQYVIPSSNISGTISSIHNVSSVTVSCRQAVLPNSVTTGYYGTFSFTVNNGLNPVVVPTKQGYYFNPAMDSTNNIQSNKTANFTMYSRLPNPVTVIFPTNNMAEVTLNLGSLQWNYTPGEYYTPPTGFKVYFPADANDPFMVVMLDRDLQYVVPIPLLEYSTTYTWKVVPFNADGDAEEIEVWSFTTQDRPQATPVLLFPPNDATGVTPNDLTLQFDLPIWEPESFFDIYCDPDSTFPNGYLERVYYTPDRTVLEYHIAALLAETPYYWFVRYSNAVDNWTSAVFKFTTGVNPVPSFVISGSIRSGGAGISTGGVTVACPGACIPNKKTTTSTDNTYSFTVNDLSGVTYYVTPTKNFYSFSPLSNSYNCDQISSDQTGQDFYIYSLVPGPVILVWPPYYAQNVNPDDRLLQWTYEDLPGYASPSGFEVYLGDNPDPIAVVLIQRDPVHTVELISPLEPNTWYDWFVIPFNANGYSEYMDLWGFETGDSLPPDPFLPQELYVYPPNGSSEKDAGLVMAWGDPQPPGDRHNFPIDSFFDVFLDTDPDLSDAPVIFSGPGMPNPIFPQQFFCYAPELNPGTLYCWQIRLTSPTQGIHYSPVWHFTTADQPVPRPEPVLWSPVNLQTNVPPAGVDLEWEFNPWQVDSFFDVFCDPDSTFPNPPVYSGSGNPARTLLEYHMAALLAETPYYWFVRYSNFVDYYYNKTQKWIFTTAAADTAAPLPPQNLSLTVAGMDAVLEWDPVTHNVEGDPITPDYYEVYCCTTDPEGEYLPIQQVPGVSCLIPGGAMHEQCYYYVKAVLGGGGGGGARPVRSNSGMIIPVIKPGRK